MKRVQFCAGIVLVAAGLVAACDGGSRQQRGQSSSANQPARSSQASRIDAALEEPNAGVGSPREGLAAAVLIDVSGSMAKRAAGSKEPKIEIARRAALDLVDQFARYAADHPAQPVLLAVYEFSSRDGQPDTREVIPMRPPDRVAAARAVRAMEADGGTPIGNALLLGKRVLDATGLSRRHVLVVTDGENTDGFEPADVAAAIGRRPFDERPSIYFVAFDVDARRFNGVRDAGGFVLEAASGKALGETIDSLLRGKILVEK